MSAPFITLLLHNPGSTHLCLLQMVADELWEPGVSQLQSNSTLHTLNNPVSKYSIHVMRMCLPAIPQCLTQQIETCLGSFIGLNGVLSNLKSSLGKLPKLILQTLKLFTDTLSPDFVLSPLGSFTTHLSSDKLYQHMNANAMARVTVHNLDLVHFQKLLCV